MSYSSGSQSSSSAPSWYTDKFLGGTVLPFATNYANSLNGGETPLAAAGRQQTLDTVTGKYLDPAANPNLQGVADVIQRNSAEALAKATNAVGQGAEQVGGLFSTKTNQQKLSAGRASAQDVADRITNLYAGNYSAERQNQVNAASAANTLDWQRLLALADALKTQVSTGSGSTMGLGIL